MNNEQQQDDRCMHATVASRTQNHVTLMTDDGQSLQVPAALLPPGIEEGAEVWFAFHTTASLAAEREKNARALLHEIMNPEGV
jgi:hypothetical protein